MRWSNDAWSSRWIRLLREAYKDYDWTPIANDFNRRKPEQINSFIGQLKNRLRQYLCKNIKK